VLPNRQRTSGVCLPACFQPGSSPANNDLAAFRPSGLVVSTAACAARLKISAAATFSCSQPYPLAPFNRHRSLSRCGFVHRAVASAGGCTSIPSLLNSTAARPKQPFAVTKIFTSISFRINTNYRPPLDSPTSHATFKSGNNLRKLPRAQTPHTSLAPEPFLKEKMSWQAIT
jgi:hypothetical protein